MMRTQAILAALILAPAALAGAQQQSSDFKWGETITGGRTVKVTNINGTVTFRQGSGDRVEVTAVKRWRRGDPNSVRVHAAKVGGDIRVCPLYEGQDDCDDHNNGNWGRRNRNDRDNDNDVSIDFTVLVPRGVHLVAGTVNGAVSVSGGTEDVEAATVNGDVTVESGRGRFSATTVSGTVNALVTTRPSSMEFTTVNGNVIVDLPASIGAEVEMTTVNGDLRSDYDIVMTGGRFRPYNLTARLGPQGGPRMRVTTVNGNVEIRKR
jgi:hypothetical protein